jgi:hypothetical protein
MADVTRRLARWKAKYQTQRVKETLDDIRDDMAARYESAIAEVYAMEGKVKETINTCGVSTALYVPYLNFGRQLYKLSRQQHIAGESFALAAQVLLEKWAARGCDPLVLSRIRTEVFNVGAPATV